ncbi:MAG: hypothetical protein GQ557_02785 [Mycoplasmataceae bacterium]|nr:hypothetical protein [Mycoplasmataceae bacterium]
MFTLVALIVSFISGYTLGKYEDENFFSLIEQIFDKAKELDIDLKQIFLDTLDMLEEKDSDEIKANFLKTIDSLKAKTTEIVSEENIEGSLDKLKEGISQVKKNFTGKK